MDRLELEESSGLIPVADDRRRIDEPPPIKLVAIDDVWLATMPGIEAALDQFYVGVWQMVRDDESPEIVYRTENFRLRFEIVSNQKPIEREGMRPQGIEVRSLREAELKLVQNEIDYIRQRGLLPGIYSLLLRDPAGNWIELFDSPPIG